MEGEMRVFMLTVAIVAGAFVIPATDLTSAPLSGVAVVDAQTSPPAQPQAPQINVEVNKGGRAWYVNPVWLAVGGAALLIVVLLIVMAGRGGGTTIVRG
jgi:hypothetical protein